MPRLLQYLLSIVFNQRKIMSDLSDLQAAVAANTVSIDNAVAIIAVDKTTIAQQAAHITELQTALDAANAQLAAGGSTDGAALQAMTAQLTADDAKLPTSTGAVAAG